MAEIRTRMRVRWDASLVGVLVLYVGLLALSLLGALGLSGWHRLPYAMAGLVVLVFAVFVLKDARYPTYYREEDRYPYHPLPGDDDIPPE